MAQCNSNDLWSFWSLRKMSLAAWRWTLWQTSINKHKIVYNTTIIWTQVNCDNIEQPQVIYHAKMGFWDLCRQCSTRSVCKSTIWSESFTVQHSVEKSLIYIQVDSVALRSDWWDAKADLKLHYLHMYDDLSSHDILHKWHQASWKWCI